MAPRFVQRGNDVNPLVDRDRCRHDTGGVRCQLVTGHRPAHAAMIQARTVQRWDGVRVWLDVEAYTGAGMPEPLPWAATFP